MKYQHLTIFLALFCITGLGASSEQFWGMSGRKLENYFSQGFSKNDFAKTTNSSELKKVRAFFKRKEGYERIVFDLSTDILPKSMVYISASSKNVTVKFQSTSKAKDYKEHKGTQMFNLYETYVLGNKTTLVKLSFKRPKEIDVFYLEKPARLVIDARVLKVKK